MYFLVFNFVETEREKTMEGKSIMAMLSLRKKDNFHSDGRL
jgi:hypothetical protein